MNRTPKTLNLAPNSSFIPHPSSFPRNRSLPWLWINIGAALDSVRGNWFRSFLTILGVVIGVASVIVLVAFGEGARREITAQIDTLGTSVAIVVPGKMKGQANFNPMGGLGISNLTEKDVAALRSVRGVRAASPVTFVGGGVFRGDKPATICMPLGVTPAFREIRRLQLSEGRFFTDSELNKPVCAIGTGVQKDLFPHEDPVGKTISVNDRKFRVLGVVKERSIGSGIFGGEELDAIIYLPLLAAQGATGGLQIHRIFMEVEPQLNPDTVVERVRQALLRTHNGHDDFTLVRAKELLNMFYKVFRLLAALLIGITSISLVVGGIGIMNIMLVSVTERTREIGIRKTVGARQRDIFYQFLTEAVTLSALGGIGGVGLAFVLCYFVKYWLPLKPAISAGSVGLGFGVCVAVGIIAGVLPAVAAARKDPIVAMRYE